MYYTSIIYIYIYIIFRLGKYTERHGHQSPSLVIKAVIIITISLDIWPTIKYILQYLDTLSPHPLYIILIDDEYL